MQLAAKLAAKLLVHAYVNLTQRIAGAQCMLRIFQSS